MENLPPPNEKKLPAPNEKLLRSPTFWERQGKTAKWLAIGSIIFFLFLMLSTLLLLSQKSTIIPIQPPQPTINAIEISSDKKSILNTETKKVVLAIEGTQAYLETSGYAYNPDTFQTTNAKYAGDCFLDAALSNRKDKIVFSTGCLPGDLPQPWIGTDELNVSSTKQCGLNTKCANSTVKFLAAGNGRNFAWSQDDKTITYEATLGLSGLTETRTIDSNTGEILEKKNISVTPNPETENYKIYRNEKLGFELTFPNKNWYLPSVTDKDPHFVANEECSDIKIFRYGNIDCSGLEVQNWTAGFSEGWETRFNALKTNGQNPIKLSSLIPEAIVIKSDAPPPGGWGLQYDIFFQTEKRRFLIFATLNETLEKAIISTFKLITPNPN